jgi:outer membrane protein OmpA-like peptidoglycan-associated protein
MAIRYEPEYELESELDEAEELELLLNQADEALFESPPRRGGGGAITFPPDVIFPMNVAKVTLRRFALNSANLNNQTPEPNHSRTLLGLSDVIVRRHGTSKRVTRIRIVGHADHAGTIDFNLDLGHRRARTVRRALQRLIEARTALVSGFQMPAFEECSAGKSRPDSSDRAENRRVEVFIE